VDQVTAEDIDHARKRIADLVAPSPLIRSPQLSGQLGADVWLKLENLQPPGSFKLRGAANKILAMSPEQRARGVIASSAGNHGVAVAYVAGLLGVRATICVPETVDRVKLQAILDFGGEAVLKGATFDEANEESRRLQEQRGLEYVHPFDDPHVIAGQGTIGLELLDELPDLAVVIAAVSGGGLAGGIGIALKSRQRPAHLIGASAAHAATMVASLGAGHPVDLPYRETLAEVLTGGIELRNRWSFDAVRRFVDGHVLVTEEEIAAAMRFALSAHHVLAEGGGAVAIAAALAGKVSPGGGSLAIVVSGGNVDPSKFLALIE
jgi:threonine dehydratase